MAKNQTPRPYLVLRLARERAAARQTLQRALHWDEEGER